MARPIVAFLTDFGTTDHYVGAMKGVVLDICREATLVDVTHCVPPQDVRVGARELSASYPWFPEGTIFVVVVDPGVGSGRRALAVEAGGRCFVAPDNGVLTPVLDAHETCRVVSLEAPRYARATISRTFEGRDRFAPAAAWLAAGVQLDALGPAVSDPRRLAPRLPRVVGERIEGEVVQVDRFGNLISNVDRRTFEQLSSGEVAIEIGGHPVPRLVGTYADAPAGALCALFSSAGFLEIAANGGSAAATLALAQGATVHITVTRGSIPAR